MVLAPPGRRSAFPCAASPEAHKGLCSVGRGTPNLPQMDSQAAVFRGRGRGGRCDGTERKTLGSPDSAGPAPEPKAGDPAQRKALRL